MEIKNKAVKDTSYINPSNSNNLNNTTNTITTKRDILNYSQANIEILSNNTVEDSISKMFFYFSMIYEIAIEYVPTSKLEEIEIINMKFKKIAEKLHKENNKQILNSFNFNSTNNNSGNNRFNNSNVNSNTNILSSSFNNNINYNVNNNKALNNLSSLTQIAPTIFDNSLFSNIKHDKSFANNKNINLFTNESNNNDVSYDSGNNLINNHASNHYGNSNNLNFNSNLINENHDITNTSIISKVVLVNSNKEDKKYLKIKQVIELKDSKDIIKENTKENTKLKFNYIAMSALDLNDNYIIIGLENGEIKVISKNNKNPESKNNHSSGNINFSICQILNNHTYPIYSLCKLDNSSFVSGEWSKQGKLVFWKTNTNNTNTNTNSNDSSHNVFLEFKSKNFNDGVSCMIKIMSGVIAIGFVSGVILFYNIFADKVFNKISLHSKEIRAMSLNNNLLISGGRDKNIFLFDIEAKKKSDFQFNLEHKSWINCLTSFNYIDNSGNSGNKKTKVINTLSNMFVISGGGDTSDPYVKIWKYGYNKSIRTLLLHSDIIIHLDYNKELDYLITGCYDGSIKKIRIDFNELVCRFSNKSNNNNNNNIEENKNNSVSGVYHILEEKILGSSIDKLIIVNNDKNNILSLNNNVNVDNNETESEYDWKNQSVEEGDIKKKLDDKLNNNNNKELVSNSNNNKELLRNKSLNESFVIMKWKNTCLSIY